MCGTKKLNTGARISLLRMDLITKLNAIDPIDDLHEDEIDIAYANASGYESYTRVNDKALAILLRNRITRFEDPCMNYVERVYDTLKEYLNSCELLTEKRGQFPNMVHEIEKIFMQVLDSKLEPTRTFTTNFIAAQFDSINFGNEDFMDINQADIMLAIQQFHMSENLRANSRCYGISNEANQTPASNPGTSDSSAVQLTDHGVRLGQHSSRKRKRIEKEHTQKGIQKKNLVKNALPAPEEVVMEAAGQCIPYGFYGSIAKNIVEGLIATTVDEDSEEAIAAKKVQHYGSLIKRYFNKVRKIIVDSMPIFISYFLINGILNTKDGLQHVLNMNLYDESRFDELFQETRNIEKYRKETINAIETLKKARETIEKVKMA